VTKITLLTEIGLRKPACEERVRLSAQDTNTKAYRVSQAQRAGRDPTLCGARGFVRFDGTVLCRAHAGQRALKIMMET